KKQNIPIIDLDAQVHKLYSENLQLIEMIGERYPGTIGPDNIVDRQKLSKYVLSDIQELYNLEAMILPLLDLQVKHFVDISKRQGHKLICVEVPLMYEKGYDLLCDKVIVIKSSRYMQGHRVLKRHGMSDNKYNIINKIQLSVLRKESLADYIIISGLHKGYVYQQLSCILRDLRNIC
ncbi:MAG: dephospho-CoA kinase, partial [Pseudomonadota bacterium]